MPSHQPSPLFEFDPVRDVPSCELGTTCWGLVGRCASPEPAQAAAALATVCWRYRPAVLAYARAHTASVHDAEDLTQGFFAFLFEQELLLRADPARGRFRAFLFTCLHRYINGEADRQGAAKRGGQVLLIPLEESLEGEVMGCASSSPAHVRRRAEEARFDRQWAFTVLDGVLDQLRAECHAVHGADAFKQLRPFLAGGVGENSAPDHGRAAAALDLGPAAFRTFLHRWRTRYRVLLRATVARTLANPADTDDEMRHLAAALATQR